MTFSFEPKLKKVLNKAYLKKPVTKDELTRFRDQLLKFTAGVDPSQPEEHAKNLLSDFLKGAFYGHPYQVNIHDKIDLTIAKGGRSLVLFETKKPGKGVEMMTKGNPNAKALQQILFYFLDERIAGKNLEIKTLVVTDIDHWFVFDARDFEALATKDKQLVKDYEAFKAGGLLFHQTGDFYSQIAQPWFEKADGELTATVIDLPELVQGLKAYPDSLEALVPLYKLLSPAHLLKEPFQNDSNTLDKNFYGELLYWMGLEEAKEGGKAVIRRPASPQPASLIELILDRLGLDDSLPAGADKMEVAMELALLWVNRLLFLKLLESQLATYHSGDRAYRFLSPGDLRGFDDLYSLFFGVLAVKPVDRREKDTERWSKVPYLNSSLFERSNLEKRVFSIDRLDNHAVLPIWTRSVLKAPDGHRSDEAQGTLDYLLAFLEAFDFSSEGTGEIQDSGKTLINASVLGLIFEKINGYKEGAFFTPGYITEYMARQSVRSAIVTKFNQVKGWDCADFKDLYNNLGPKDLKEANGLINSLKILDPAVGSGHFLVSVLNELIAAKSDLDLLCDPQGNRLKNHVAVVENDELFLLDEDGDFVGYHAPFVANERQRVWETIFHEKRTLIENCLFGVDINPNSVQICKLRLWIELLKHAYYTAESGYAELETLPNLDIKIREGNSLVSRYALDVPLNKIGTPEQGLMTQYVDLVRAYQETPDKKTKADIEEHIKGIKAKIVADLEEGSPLRMKHDKARGKVADLDAPTLFGLSPAEEKARQKKLQVAQKELAEVRAQLEDEARNPIYRHSFEWRFEFPEVLDPETGAFVGFDVVIGNPPYIRQEELTPFKRYFESRYVTFDGVADIYVYFVERAMSLVVDSGRFGYILPNKWMRANYGRTFRNWIKENFKIEALIDFGDLPVFEAATTYPCVFFMEKSAPTPQFRALLVPSLENLSLTTTMAHDSFEVAVEGLDSEGWALVERKTSKLLKKLLSTGTPLGKVVGGKIYYGIKTGLNEAFVIDRATRDRLVAEDPNNSGILKPFLAGRDVKRYESLRTDKFLIFLPKGWTKEHCPEGRDPWTWVESTHPSLASHLKPHEQAARNRSDQGDYWWELRACDYYDEFERPKIIYAEISQAGAFTLDANGFFGDTTSFIMASDSSALIGILNSKLFTFVFSQISSSIQGGFFRWKFQYLERMPIPPALSSLSVFAPSRAPSSSSSELPRLESLVTSILAAKKSNPAADTQPWEDEIDQIVYRLYGLTDDEIAIVEGSA